MKYSFFVDVLSMPETILGVYAGVSKSIAFILFGALFTFAIITKQIKLIAGKEVDLKETIWKACLVVVALVLYNHIFLKIIAINEAISMSLINFEDFGKFQFALEQHLKDSSISLVNFNVGKVLGVTFLFISTIAENILLHLRYIILAILYIIGPLALVAGILPATSALTKGWFKTLLQVSFWIIVLRIIQTTLLSLNTEQALSQNANFIEFGFVAVLLTILTFMVPMITEKLMSGANMGMMAGVAMGAMAGVGSKFTGASKTTLGVAQGVTGVVGSVAKGIKNAPKSIQNIASRLLDSHPSHEKPPKSKPKR